MRLKRALKAYDIATGSNMANFGFKLNGAMPDLPPSLIASIYGAYLQVLHSEHNHAFLLDDMEGINDPLDVQLAIYAEIEIVEDYLSQINP